MKLMNFAQDEQEKGDIPQSAEYAYQAELSAQIASAKARQHRAQQSAVTIREQTYQQVIRIHELELEIAGIRETILEAQLARALNARDKGQQETAQLSTEITGLQQALRQAELRLTLANVESFVSISKYIHPAMERTGEYERVQTAIVSIADFIDRAAFAEAEAAIPEAREQAEKLYQRAELNREAANEAEMNAHIALTRAEVVIAHAQYLNAAAHVPQRFQQANDQLKRAKQALAAGRYQQAQQLAEQAQQNADETVKLAESAEFRQRAQQELDRLVSAAKQAVTALKRDLTAQAETEVPQLAARLYQLANSAHTKAQTALANEDYEIAIATAEEGSDYLERAMEDTHRITSAKSDLVAASRQIPKAIVIEQRDGVLIRIRGNAFAHGSTQLQKAFSDTFTQLAKILRSENFSSYPVRIEVHTSALGNASVNRNVSLGRADSIKRTLVEDGKVDRERLTAVGLGETQPIVTEGADKEEQNRRIDVIIKTN